MVQDLLNSPVFGILLSIIGFEIGLYIYRKTKIALFNPLLICIALIVCILISFNIKLDNFNKGGNLISFFLGPATVALAVPLYKKINVIKKICYTYITWGNCGLYNCYDKYILYF